jgi:AraC-like DNA-binding protein
MTCDNVILKAGEEGGPEGHRSVGALVHIPTAFTEVTERLPSAAAALTPLVPSPCSPQTLQTTDTNPAERITRAQQVIRETSWSLFEIALEVGYTGPSHFAQVFRRIVGVTPTEFRSAL